MRYLMVALASVLLLSGCKAKVGTEVGLTDLLESETKMLSGSLLVEVASCNSHEDSRKPSNSVVEMQNTVPTIFQGAEYVECYSQRFKSFVHFTLPVVLDKDADGAFASEQHVNLISNPDTLLMVGIPEQVKNRLEQAKKNNFGAQALDLEIEIKVNNDTGQDFPFKAIATYIDNSPLIFGNLTAKPRGSFVARLSDVSTDSALQQGTAMVLMR